MNALIKRISANPVFSNLLMVGLVAAGIASLFSITVKNFPEINLGAVQVSVVYPGATPQEVADSIIVPIEGKVRAIDGIKRITGTALDRPLTVIGAAAASFSRAFAASKVQTLSCVDL